MKGYILVSTLIIMSLLLMLVLGLMEAQRWQEKLAADTLQSEQREWQLQQFMHEVRDEISKTSPPCFLTWDSLENTWTLLESAESTICVRKKDNMEIRYVLVRSSALLSARIDFIARANDKMDWGYYQDDSATPTD